MKETIVKCKCDYCNGNMSEYDYENAIKITIRVDVPCHKGGAGACNGISMSLCNKCAENLGIVESEIHNGYVGTEGRIKTAIEKCKTKILEMFFNKKSLKSEEK